MQAAAKEATIIRKKRQQSIRAALNPTTLNNDKLHEKLEGGIRKMKKSLTKVSRSLRRKESTVDESGNIRRASILVAMIAIMDDDVSASHRSSLLRRNISNISSSGELGSSSTKGILKHSSSYPSFGEVESDSPAVHEVLPTIESKEEKAESNLENKEEIRRRGKRDKDRRSITKQVDIEGDTNKDEHMNDEGATDITEEGGEEVVEDAIAEEAKQDGKVDTAEVDMNKAEADIQEVEEASTTLEEAADIKDEAVTNNNDASTIEDVTLAAKKEADNIEREGMIVSENDNGDTSAEDDEPSGGISPSSFETKSTAGEEEDPTDEGKTEDEGNTSFSLRDLGCDHAKYLSIKNDIRSASSSVLMKL